MNINWNRWIMELFPLKMRTVLIFAFSKVLNAHIITLYTEFTKWQKKMRVHAGATPQVCMIKKIVRDEMDIDIQIEEGNGKPVDFIIKTSFSSVDKERQLFAVLERYKLAGKNYGYENAEITLSGVWSQYSCEKGDISSEWKKYNCELSEAIATWEKYVCETSNVSAEWNSYLCEQAEATVAWTEYTCEKVFEPDINRIYFWFGSGYVWAQAEFPPTSDLIINFERFYPPNYYGETVHIPAGSTEAAKSGWNGSTEITDRKVKPGGDDKYRYVLTYKK